MSVESVIIENSKEKIKALAPRAKKAFEKPDHGIKIVTQGAYYVIRDCAMIADKYLVLLLYGQYSDPIETLKGKFTSKDFSDMIKSKDIHIQQLCKLMVLDALEVAEIEQKSKESPANIDDIYGDYDNYEDAEQENIEFDFNNKEHVLEILTKVFGK